MFDSTHTHLSIRNTRSGQLVELYRTPAGWAWVSGRNADQPISLNILHRMQASGVWRFVYYTRALQ